MTISSVGSGSVQTYQQVQDTSTGATVADGAVTTAIASTCFDPTKGPNGTIKYGDATYDIKDGKVSLNGQTIGDVNDNGDYSVSLMGQTVQGNVANLIGASINGTLSNGTVIDNRASGTVEIGLETFKVEQGVVTKDGVAVGTMNESGAYNVTLNGQQAVGNITDVVGAVFNGTDHTGKVVDNRATGTVSFGSETFDIKNGEVFKGETKVGTIDAKGGYNVTIDGQQTVGNINQIPGAVINGKLSDGTSIDNRVNGTIDFGTEHFEAKNGDLYRGETKVGTIASDGRYNVTIDGKQTTGNVLDIPGAIFNGTAGAGTIDNRVTGTVQFGNANFSIKDGAVFQGETRVGTLNAKGDYNVTIDGKQTTGNVNDIPGVIFQGSIAGGQTVDNRVDGSIRFGDQTFTVVKGEVFQGETKVGTVNQLGVYNVTINGEPAVGNLNDIPGVVIQGTTADGTKIDTSVEGKIAFGDNTYTVRYGSVFLGDSRTSVGTIDSQGRYNITINGQQTTGNIMDVPGAIVSGTTADGTKFDNRVSGEITIGTEKFTVTAGEVFQNGTRIGTIDNRGRYNVNYGGSQQVGMLGAIPGVSFSGTLADGTPIASQNMTAQVADLVRRGVIRQEDIDQQNRLQIDGRRYRTMQP